MKRIDQCHCCCSGLIIKTVCSPRVQVNEYSHDPGKTTLNVTFFFEMCYLPHLNCLFVFDLVSRRHFDLIWFYFLFLAGTVWGRFSLAGGGVCAGAYGACVCMCVCVWKKEGEQVGEAAIFQRK